MCVTYLISLDFSPAALNLLLKLQLLCGLNQPLLQVSLQLILTNQSALLFHYVKTQFHLELLLSLPGQHLPLLLELHHLLLNQSVVILGLLQLQLQNIDNIFVVNTVTVHLGCHQSTILFIQPGNILSFLLLKLFRFN